MKKNGELHTRDTLAKGEGHVSWRTPLQEVYSNIFQYLAAAGVVAFVALICYPFRSLLGYQTVSLILLLTVALLPLRLGAGPVLLAAAMSALLWDYFFIPPHYTFAIGSGQDVLMLVAYFTIAAVTGTLTARIRTRQKALVQREERATALYNLTSDLANARDQNEVAKAAVTNIHKVFGVDVAIFLNQQDGDIFTEAHGTSMFSIDSKEFSVAAWVYWNEKKAGKFTDTLPSAQATYYPMSGPRYPLGVIGVRTYQKSYLTPDQKTLLLNFITQIASTIEREQLNEMAKQSTVLIQSEKLYKTLFNSISHELRTPIAAIISASEGLLSSRTSHQLPALIQEIQTAAERLNRLVENLLNMTRIETGRIAPSVDWCDIRDIVNSAIRKLRRELASHSVSATVEPNIPLVRADFGLIEQAITNILHNASLYTASGTKVDVRAFTQGADVILTISDNGPGFPKEFLPRIMEKFYRVPGTQVGGTGLGLSIARGFVEAHGGTLRVENLPEGGASFTISLPLQTQNQKTIAELP